MIKIVEALTIELEKHNFTTRQKIEELNQHVTKEKDIVDVIVEHNVVEEDVVLDILSDVYGIPYVNIGEYMPEEEAVVLIPLEICQRHTILPLFKIRNTLMIATANPADINMIDEIRVRTGFGIEPILCLHAGIVNAIETYLVGHESVGDMLDSIVEEEEEDLLDTANEVSDASDEPVIKLVNTILLQAVRDRASDIHLNPDEKKFRVRYRIDGVLYEVGQPPLKLQNSVISRIKIMARMDIAEKRKPQDGRIEFKLQGKAIDLRVSTIPTIYGENVVMRILDKSSVLLGLEDLGFGSHDLSLFKSVVCKPYGIVVAVGPTGSGKTTTLYSALGTINTIDKNIMTLEDPVEYNLPLIRQSQVHTKAGYTFANGLRAMLRQDPDVILVGEIRDEETAHIAAEAALTGHLVFSTLHTNDAPGTVVRLSEMGVKPFLIGSTLLCVIAQRLARKLCPKCTEKYIPEPEVLKDLNIKNDVVYFHRGKGCSHCKDIGYRGRVGLYELMLIEDDVRNAILHEVTEDVLRGVAIKAGMQTLRDDGVNKVLEGKTSIEEVFRVTR